MRPRVYLFCVLSFVSKGVLGTGPSVSGKWPRQQTLSVCPQAARFDAEISVVLVQYTHSNCWFSVSLWKNVVHSILSYWHFALAVFGFLFSICFFVGVAYSPIVQYTHSNCWFSVSLWKNVVSLFHHSGHSIPPCWHFFSFSFLFLHMLLCWRWIFPNSTIHTFQLLVQRLTLEECGATLFHHTDIFLLLFLVSFSPYVSLLALNMPR